MSAGWRAADEDAYWSVSLAIPELEVRPGEDGESWARGDAFTWTGAAGGERQAAKSAREALTRTATVLKVLTGVEGPVNVGAWSASAKQQDIVFPETAFSLGKAMAARYERHVRSTDQEEGRFGSPEAICDWADEALNVAMSAYEDGGDLCLGDLQRGEGAAKGNGAKALAALCEFADHHGQSIGLVVMMGNEQLVAFYERFGFAVSGRTGDEDEDATMVRAPRKGKARFQSWGADELKRVVRAALWATGDAICDQAGTYRAAFAHEDYGQGLRQAIHVDADHVEAGTDTIVAMEPPALLKPVLMAAGICWIASKKAVLARFKDARVSIEVPESATLRAALRAQIARDRKENAAIAADFLRKVGLDADAEAYDAL